MSNRRPVLCSCCGTECTMPQFYNGKPYGYTCITKVAPDYKRSKDNGLWIATDKTEVIHANKSTPQAMLKVFVNGVSFNVPCRVDKDSNLVECKYYRDRYLRIAEYKNGASPLFKSIEILQGVNSKGKKYPVKAVRIFRDKDVVLCEF